MIGGGERSNGLHLNRVTVSFAVKNLSPMFFIRGLKFAAKNVLRSVIICDMPKSTSPVPGNATQRISRKYVAAFFAEIMAWIKHKSMSYSISKVVSVLSALHLFLQRESIASVLTTITKAAQDSRVVGNAFEVFCVRIAIGC